MLNIPKYSKHIQYCSFLFILNLISAAPYLLFPSKTPGLPGFNDFYVFVFYVTYIARIIDQGILPIGVVWNTLSHCGYPATILNGLPTIPALFVLLVYYLTRDAVISVKATFFLFSLLASYSMYYTMYKIEKNHRVSLISSVAFTFLNRRAFMAHLGISFTYCILPLLTIVWIKTMQQKKIMNLYLGCFLLSVLALSHGYSAYFTHMFIFFLTIYFILFEKNQKKNTVSYIGVFMLSLIITIPFLLPVFEIYRTARAGYTHWIYIRYSVRPLQLFFPILLIEKGEIINYLGISVLFLVAMKLYFAIRRIKKRNSTPYELFHNPKFIIYLVGVACFFLIGSLGIYTPLYGLLFDYLPLFKNFRAPPRMLIIVHLIFGIFSGLGARELYVTIQKSKTFIFNKFSSDFFTYLISIVIFFDLSVYFGITQNSSSPLMTTYSAMDDQEFVQFGFGKYIVSGFIFTPATDIPSDRIKESISQDPTECRILFVTRESRSHFRVYNLANKSFASGSLSYITPRQYDLIQQEIIRELRKTDIPSYIGEKLALLGVKYIIYDSTEESFWSINYLPRINAMKKSEDLRFLLESDGLYLFENIRFSGMYMTFKKLPADLTQLFKEQVNCKINIQRMSEIKICINITAHEPLYIIMSQSYDPQWLLNPPELKNHLIINQYYNMTSIFVKTPGEYEISLIYRGYYNYLYYFLYFEIPAVALLVFLWVISKKKYLSNKMSFLRFLK